MSSLFGIAANGASEFYTTKINQSLRFNKPDTPYLERTFVTPSSTRKVIISTWIKPSELGSTTPIMYSAPTSATSSYFLMGFAQSGYIDSNDSFKIFQVEGNSQKIALRTNAKFRDITNWLHVCVAIDSEQTTSTDRVMLFFNGKRYTGGYDSYNTFPSQNHDFTVMNSAIKHRVGATSNGLHSNYGNLQGYLSEFYFIDGQSMFSDTSGTINSTFLADANTLATFCEQKNGVAIPKTYSGTFGNNGCRLTFQATGTGTTSQGTTAQTNIGDDQSGQGHNFSVNGLASTDVVLDSPTNNFCTLNPLNANDHRGEASFSRGNLRMTSGSTSRGFTSGTMKIHGKVYFEVLSRDGNNGFVGIHDIENSAVSNGQTLDMYQGTPRIDGVTGSGTGTFSDGDIMGVAVDVDAKSLQFFRNNSSVYSVTYTTDVEYFPILHDSSGGRTSDFVANFGQDSSFTGEKTAQGNTDSNGQGDFYYTPPSGFLALCSANLPDTELAPNQGEQATDYFNTVLYTGNSTSRSIAVGFQPDWTWIKARSVSSDHYVFDSNRGTPNKSLSTNDNGVEDTTSGQFTQFTATGFDLPADSAGYVNYNSRTYAAWNWRVNGGTTSTDNNGSLTSTVQTNSKAGISIATFTVPSQANFSFGHGLGSVPEMFWWKSRTDTQNWIVYHFAKTTSVPNQTGMYLNSTLAGFTTGANWITELSSTRIAITDGQVSSGSNRDNVVYSFKSVEGFSKIGSYTGNGNADGTFVYTGFKPALIIIKDITSTDPWHIIDNKRSPRNLVKERLFPNNSNAENTSADICDFVSNGIKFKGTNDGFNGSRNYIYMAFAESPFVNSNGVPTNAR